MLFQIYSWVSAELKQKQKQPARCWAPDCAGDDGFLADYEQQCEMHLCLRAQPGDQIVAISASFGTDVWEAKNFGQVMYAIKTRNGQVYMKLKRNFGDLSSFVVRTLSQMRLPNALVRPKWRFIVRTPNVSRQEEPLGATPCRCYVALSAALL